MAERHVVVVRLRDGEVAGVEFCDCCPGVTLEVRAYTDDHNVSAEAEMAWQHGAGAMLSGEYERDEHGVFRLTCYEPWNAEE